jgi:hypothetical protein
MGAFNEIFFVRQQKSAKSDPESVAAKSVVSGITNSNLEDGPSKEYPHAFLVVSLQMVLDHAGNEDIATNVVYKHSKPIKAFSYAFSAGTQVTGTENIRFLDSSDSICTVSRLAGTEKFDEQPKITKLRSAKLDSKKVKEQKEQLFEKYMADV